MVENATNTSSYSDLFDLFTETFGIGSAESISEEKLIEENRAKHKAENESDNAAQMTIADIQPSGEEASEYASVNDAHSSTPYSPIPEQPIDDTDENVDNPFEDVPESCDDESPISDHPSWDNEQFEYCEPIVHIPIDQVFGNEDNPCDSDTPLPDYVELKESIERNGIVEPITVYPCGKEYVVISGNRRLSIWKSLGYTTIKARILLNTPWFMALRIMLESNLRRAKNPTREMIRIIQSELKQLNGDKREAIKTLPGKYGLCEREIRRYIDVIKGLPKNYLDLIGVKLSFAAASDIVNAKLNNDDLQAIYELIVASENKLNTKAIKDASKKRYGRDLLESTNIRAKSITFTQDEIMKICGESDVSAKELKKTILDIVANYKIDTESI